MKAILVGLGGRGRYWFDQCRKQQDVDVVACVEPSAQNRERAVAQCSLAERSIYRNLGEACAAVQADFVLDVTPPAIHEEIAMQTFAAGLHLLGEKPLSDQYEAARRVVEAGTQAGVAHMITQNYRFNGLPRTTRRLLTEDLIGPVGQLDVSLYVNWADSPGSHYVTEPYMFLTDMGIHHFDMMRYTLGQDPVSAHALTWEPPLGLAPRRRRSDDPLPLCQRHSRHPPRHRLHGRARASRAQRRVALRRAARHPDVGGLRPVPHPLAPR